MGRPPALLPLSALLTLCITAGTPEVWVQVKMEAAESLSFTVHCGFLGPGSLSLVTVTCGESEDAKGTKLAVLSPQSGTWHWDPDCQAHWETGTSISLTLRGSEGRRLSPNTTFCCKFVSFPEGSQEACRSHLLSTVPGLPAPSPASGLRADLAGILGVSGALLLGCIYLLHLLCQQKHRSILQLQPLCSLTQTPQHTRAANEASQTSLHLPSACVGSNSRFPATLHTCPPALPLSPAQWQPLAQPPATLAALYATARGSFISVENGLYAQMAEGPLISKPAGSLYSSPRIKTPRRI